MFKSIVILILLNIYSNCSLGCLKCETEKCQICDSQKGFYLHNNVCFQNDLSNCLFSSYKNICQICQSNYFQRLNKTCKEIVVNKIDNCSDYYDDNNCRQCNTGYYINKGECEEVKVHIDNCYVYKDSSSCQFCKKGFYLKNNTCIQFQEIQNCIAYNNPFHCSKCINRYYLNENYYVDLINEFYPDIIQKKIEIDQYKSNQIFNMPQCQRIQEIQFCEIHKNALQCQQCQSGYYLQTPTTCSKNPESLYTLNDFLNEHCYAFDHTSNCQFCYNSFYLKENKCVKHDILQPNCFLYSAYINSSCLICNPGYYRVLENQLYVCKKIQNQISFCEEYAVDDDKCAKCFDGFIMHFDKKKCSQQIKNCKQYDTTLAVLSCKICQRGSTLENGTCQDISNNCLRQNDNGICEECELGYILDQQNVCIQRSNLNKFSMCKKQQSSTQCLNCFYYDKKFQLESVCTQGIDNCYQYDQNGNCQHCSKGYKLSQGSCQKNDNINCDYYDRTIDKCIKCKDSYILSQDQQTCFKIHITSNKHNNPWCIDSNNDYQCNICFPGYAPFKNFEYQYQKNLNFQKKSENNLLIDDCLIYSKSNSKCLLCVQSKILNSLANQCIDNCDIGQTINILNNQCQVFTNNQCQYTDGISCLKCKQKGLIDINDFQQFNQLKGWQINQQNINFKEEYFIKQKQCYTTGDFDFKFIDKNFREIEHQWGKTAVIEEQRTDQDYHTITYQDIDCDESITYQFPSQFRSYQQTLTCHKCNNNKFLIVNYSNGNRVIDVSFEQQNFLNGQNTIQNLQVNCLATNYSSILNCAIQENIYQIEGTDSQNYKCIMCQPGYEPVYDDDEFITECKLIQHCDSSNTLNECDVCTSGYNFYYDEFNQQPTRTSCHTSTDNNCIVWSQMYNHCHQCSINYQYSISQGKCIKVNIYDDCLTNFESKNCYVKKQQNNEVVQTIIDTTEEISCQPINFYSEELTQKNCLLLDTNKNCSQCPKNYFLFQGKCLGNQQITNCQQFLIEDDNIKCSQCKIGYLLNTDKTVCTKNFNGNATDIPNCIKLEETGSCGLCQDNYVLVSKFNQQTQKYQKYCVSLIKPYGCLEIHENLATDQQNILCKVCQDGYQFKTLEIANKQQFCQSPSIITNCLIMNENVCDICQIGYYQKYGICYLRNKVVPLCQQYDPYDDECLKILKNQSLWEREVDYLSDYNMNVFDDNELAMIKKLPESREDFGPGIANCEVYISQSSCKYCKSGFYVKENKCIIVKNSVENCKYYSSDTVCEICRNNYLLLENKCVEIEVDNCLEYLSSSQCKVCLDSHPILKNGVCSKPENFSEKCKKFKQDSQTWQCEQCENKYYPDGKDCLPITLEIENCEIYETESSCKQCSVNYYRKNNNCTLIDNMEPNCLEKNYNTSCSICDLGYYLKNNQCIQCPNSDRCDFCSHLNPEKCIVCKSGYFMNNDKECMNQLNQFIINGFIKFKIFIFRIYGTWNFCNPKKSKNLLHVFQIEFKKINNFQRKISFRQINQTSYITDNFNQNKIYVFKDDLNYQIYHFKEDNKNINEDMKYIIDNYFNDKIGILQFNYIHQDNLYEINFEKYLNKKDLLQTQVQINQQIELDNYLFILQNKKDQKFWFLYSYKKHNDQIYDLIRRLCNQTYNDFVLEFDYINDNNIKNLKQENKIVFVLHFNFYTMQINQVNNISNYDIEIKENKKLTKIFQKELYYLNTNQFLLIIISKMEDDQNTNQPQIIKYKLTQKGINEMKKIKKDCQKSLFQYYFYGTAATYLIFFLAPKKYINRYKLIYPQIIYLRSFSALLFVSFVSYRSTWSIKNNMIYLQRKLLEDKENYIDEI